jgi:nicotinate-nucleotide pyrophosphorylase (carboxylating)
MHRDFPQVEWNAQTEAACRELVRLAIREDLARGYDWTTVVLVPEAAQAQADVVPRRAGVIAGLPAGPVIVREFDRELSFQPLAADGAVAVPGQPVARVAGPARSLLTAERTLLNILGRLSGVATLTRRYVDAVADSQARIYDTRKTLVPWRILEKYAVRQGGGHNHRLGLFDAVLIKDNHLALGREATGAARFTPAEAVRRVREFRAGLPAGDPRREMIVEVEVDSLAQLDEVLPVAPDLVLLDNLPPAALREAVARRDAAAPGVELEASGGVSLETVAAIAASGVDRISVGALTHSAPWFDLGLDWRAVQPGR